MSIEKRKNQSERSDIQKRARTAVDNYLVDLNVDSLREYFDIKGNQDAKTNAPYLIEGNTFKKSFYSILNEKRKSKMGIIIEALKKIDAERYAEFTGTPE